MNSFHFDNAVVVRTITMNGNAITLDYPRIVLIDFQPNDGVPIFMVEDPTKENHHEVILSFSGDEPSMKNGCKCTCDIAKEVGSCEHMYIAQSLVGYCGRRKIISEHIDCESFDVYSIGEHIFKIGDHAFTRIGARECIPHESNGYACTCGQTICEHMYVALRTKDDIEAVRYAAKRYERDMLS